MIFQRECFLILIFAALITSVPVKELADKIMTTKNPPKVECARFENTTLLSTPSSPFGEIIDVMMPLPSKNVQCSDQCITFICHSDDNITYGGGCIEDFDEMCKDRPNYKQRPGKNEDCSKVKDSFVSFQCSENGCNEISKQKDGIMRCMINTLVEDWTFSVGENLYNLVPLNDRPKHDVQNPWGDDDNTTLAPTATSIKPNSTTTKIPVKPVTNATTLTPSGSTSDTFSNETSTQSKATINTVSKMFLVGFFIALFY